MSWYSFFTTGNIVGTKFCYDDLPNRLDVFDNDAFEKSNVNYYVGATNCETGEGELILCDTLRGEDIHYIRASASMPFVSEIVEINDKKYLDGGIGDSIPVKRMMKEGYDKNVVVLTRADGYRKKPELPLLAKLVYKKYPKLVESMVNRHNMYNETIDEIHRLEKENKIVVIRPSRDLNISRMEHDQEKIEQQYELGRADALAKLEEIKLYIK